MPKVALIIGQFPSPEHPYITDWAKGLVEAGIDLTIFAEQPASASSFERSDSNKDFWPRVRWMNRLSHPWITLQANWHYNLKGLLKATRVLIQLLKEHPGKRLTAIRKLYEYLPLLGEKFDIVHFNAPQIAVRRFELGKMLGGKTIVSFRGQDISFDAARFAPLLDKADHLHFISDHLVELASQQGYRGDKHTLIPPMVDMDFYQPAEPKVPQKTRGESFRIFTAARFTWTKGWEYALQAVALLEQRGWNIQYIIAGQGELREMILYTIDQLDITNVVQLKDWQSPEQVRDQMQQADIYLLTSVEEAFNNSVLQAQACGLPVVCSDAGGLPENIVDGVTGYLCRRRDAWDTTEKIKTILSNPELRTSLGRAARSHAEKQFSLNSGVEKFQTMYKFVHESTR